MVLTKHRSPGAGYLGVNTMAKIIEVLVSTLHWTVFPQGYGEETVRSINIPREVYEGLPWNRVNGAVNRWLEDQGLQYRLSDNFNRGTQAAEIVESKEGFTSEEYTRLTGKPVPNQYNSPLIAEGEDGKVYAHPENGGISIQRGASTFNKKGRLITKVCRTVPDLVILPETW